jgi:hypothetical protein
MLKENSRSLIPRGFKNLLWKSMSKIKIYFKGTQKPFQIWIAAILYQVEVAPLQTSSKRQGGFIVVYRLMAKVSDAHQVEATPRRKALTV